MNQYQKVATVLIRSVSVGAFALGVFGLLYGAVLQSRGASLAAGAALGFVEATLGWAISWLTGPRGVSLDMYAIGIVALVIVVVTLVGAGMGALGGVAGRRVSSRAAQRSRPLPAPRSGKTR